MKKSIPVVLSHPNPLAYLFRTDVNGAWSVHICLLIQVRQLFFSEESNIKDRVLNFCFTKRWLTGVVWITCRLMWCFYQLFELSFWRHPFTAEDLLVNKWCHATLHQIGFDKETNSATYWMAWGWVSANFIFWVNYTFRDSNVCLDSKLNANVLLILLDKMTQLHVQPIFKWKFLHWYFKRTAFFALMTNTWVIISVQFVPWTISAFFCSHNTFSMI